VGRRTGVVLDAAARRLTAAGSYSARLDAELLLGKVTGWSRTEVLAHPERILPTEVERVFAGLVARRAASEPIAYLLGEREFYGRLFRVDRRALIPRPETELLVELGIAAIIRWRGLGVVEPRVVDVGTGCGAIAVSVALEAGMGVIATDLSVDALELARENALRLGARIGLVASDLLTAMRGSLHVVLANLPYVPSNRLLPSDVRDYEPALALFGGQRGTELIERLLEQATRVLAPGGEVCVELDEEKQAEPVAALARRLYPASEVRVVRDAGGYDRVVRVVI
jgi:release factor glutamine methyltransferase